MAAILIAFAGAVECRPLGASALLSVSGREAAGPNGGAQHAQVLFSGLPSREALPLLLRAPVTLHDVRVLDCSMTRALVAPESAALSGAGAHCRYRIDAREGGFELPAVGAQLHRQAAAAFYGALPIERVPRSVRLGWLVLLTTLRVPGAAGLLGRLRR